MRRPKLPETWRMVPLSVCLESNDSGTWGDEPLNDKNDYPVLRSTNIQNGQMVFHDVAMRSLSFSVAKRYEMATGDILVTKASGSQHLIGKSAIFTQPDDEKTYLFSNFTQRLRPNSNVILPEYLALYLRSALAYQYLERMHSTTSGLRNLDMKVYAEQPLPLPPLAEQRRIVEILSLAEEIRDDRRRMLEGGWVEREGKKERVWGARDLLPALFQEMFGSGKPKDDFSDSEKIENLITIPLGNGYSPVVENDPPGIPVLGLGSITDHGIDLSHLKYLRDESYSGKGDDLEINDILITRSNTLELVGKASRYMGTPKPVIFSDLMIRLRPKSDIDSFYVENYWRSKYAKSEIRRLARGTSSSMKKISQGDINKFRILWPSDKNRENFFEKSSQLSDLFGTYESIINELDVLQRVLLNRAFSGLLTKKWRGDNPDEDVSDIEIAIEKHAKPDEKDLPFLKRSENWHFLHWFNFRSRIDEHYVSPGHFSVPFNDFLERFGTHYNRIDVFQELNEVEKYVLVGVLDDGTYMEEDGMSDVLEEIVADSQKYITAEILIKRSSFDHLDIVTLRNSLSTLAAMGLIYPLTTYIDTDVGESVYLPVFRALSESDRLPKEVAFETKEERSAQEQQALRDKFQYLELNLDAGASE